MKRVLRNGRRHVRGVQNFKACLSSGRQEEPNRCCNKTSGPEADSSIEVVSVKRRREKRMIKINA